MSYYLQQYTCHACSQMFVLLCVLCDYYYYLNNYYSLALPDHAHNGQREGREMVLELTLLLKISGGAKQRAFFDVRVFNPLASSVYVPHQSQASTDRRKKRRDDTMMNG